MMWFVFQFHRIVYFNIWIGGEPENIAINLLFLSDCLCNNRASNHHTLIIRLNPNFFLAVALFFINFQNETERTRRRKRTTGRTCIHILNANKLGCTRTCHADKTLATVVPLIIINFFDYFQFDQIDSPWYWFNFTRISPSLSLYSAHIYTHSIISLFMQFFFQNKNRLILIWLSIWSFQFFLLAVIQSVH